MEVESEVRIVELRSNGPFDFAQGGFARGPVPTRTEMTADQYLELVVRMHTVKCGAGSVAERALVTLGPTIREWAGEALAGISFSGSYAKGTAISLGTDVDLFVSLNDMNGASMKDIYWGLHGFLKERGFHATAGNVAVRVEWDGMKVDLVPGRRRASSNKTPTLSQRARQGWGTPVGSEDHTLYRRKADSWMQTNVGEHIRLIAESGRTAEIRALKIWRARQGLEFPSFYLELTVLEALRGSRKKIAENVAAVLAYIGERLDDAVVVDPANSNNYVSEDMTKTEKQEVMAAARKAVAMKRWELVLW